MLHPHGPNGRRITGETEQNEILDGRSPVGPLVVWRFAPRKQWILISRSVVAGAKRPQQPIIIRFPHILHTFGARKKRIDSIDFYMSYIIHSNHRTSRKSIKILQKEISHLKRVCFDQNCKVFENIGI